MRAHTNIHIHTISWPLSIGAGLKALIYFFSILQQVLVFGGFNLQKKKSSSWARVSLSPTFPNVEGLLIFPEAIAAVRMPEPISWLIFPKP